MKLRGQSKIRRDIEAAIAHWRPILGVAHWQVHVMYAPAPDQEAASAACTAAPEYREAWLYFNLDVLQRQVEHSSTRALVSYLVLHELCHAPLYALSMLGKEYVPAKVNEDAVEATTTAMARAVWVAHYGKEPPEYVG